MPDLLRDLSFSSPPPAIPHATLAYAISLARHYLGQRHDVSPREATRRQLEENDLLASRALFEFERAAGFPQSIRRAVNEEARIWGARSGVGDG